MINIIALLQIALSLLSNRQVQANPALLAQANSFAVEAVQLAEESLTTQVSTTTTTPEITPIMIPVVPFTMPTSSHEPQTYTPQTSASSQTLGTASASSVSFDFVPGINEISVGSTSISFYVNQRNIVFDDIEVTFRCDLRNSPNCATPTSTYNATQSSESNPIIITGLTPSTRYIYDVSATKDGITKTQIGSMGELTSQE